MTRRPGAAALAAIAILLAAAPATAQKERAAPRPQRAFDHAGHASKLRAARGSSEGCAGACHRIDLAGEWTQRRKKEHTRCFEGCHTFTTSCGEMARGVGRVCLTCHVNLKQACLPAGARAAAPAAPSMPALYSHRTHARPGQGSKGCQACHGELGDRPPRARGAGAIGHRDCAGCHERQSSPRMTQCTSCHQAGAPAAAAARAPDPYAVGGAFSHQRHAAQRKVGAAGRECMACHANIASAPDGEAVPMPTMRGCLDGCHDGQKAFSAVGAACTRCHKASEPDVPAPSAARFSHRAHGERGVDVASCAACHALERDFAVAPATRGKEHRPCANAGCHIDDFLSRARPLCTVCHEGTAPWLRQVARVRRPGETRVASEFGSDFSHRSHVGARAASTGGDCRACHGDRTGGGAPASGHAACAPCHGVRAQPAMDRCGGCHASGAEAARPPPAGPWSVAARFRHETHGVDPRGGEGAARETRCTECHAGVDQAERLSQIRPPTMKSCGACHDGTHAFKTTGFGCAKCHGVVAAAPGGAQPAAAPTGPRTR